MNTPTATSLELASLIKREARELGFNLVGITSAEPSKHRDYLRGWLDEGRHGTMAYLADRFEERTDPANYMPAARSVVCVAINYHTSADPGTGTEDARITGRIARYAWGQDYHVYVQNRLHKLADWIRRRVPGSQTRCGVDTAPILERELAARAGIGWIGKNTCVINPQIGSWILLGEILTSLELPSDAPAEVDHCGTCSRCIDACPTGALTEPRNLDATRCISYLTIETRRESDITNDLRPKIGDWIFGCDVCQDVCPFNSKAPDSNDAATESRFENGRIDVEEVLAWRAGEHKPRLVGSALRRVKLPMFRRNARIVIENRARTDSN